MPVALRSDPYRIYRFGVEIDGLIVAGFSEVSGLEMEIQTEDYEEGGVNDYIHKLPHRVRFPNITLKRGMTDDEAFWKWYTDAAAGKIERKSGRIILLDQTGAEKWHWTFEGAYPVKWTGPDFRADQSSVAIETFELAHNGFKKQAA